MNPAGQLHHYILPALFALWIIYLLFRGSFLLTGDGYCSYHQRDLSAKVRAEKTP